MPPTLADRVRHILEAIGRVAQACRAAQLPLGIFAASAVGLVPYITQGFTLLAAGVDAVLLGQSAQALHGELRHALVRPAGADRVP